MLSFFATQALMGGPSHTRTKPRAELLSSPAFVSGTGRTRRRRSDPWHLRDMPKLELEATSEPREATLDLAGAEAVADLTDAAVAAYAGGARELVFDLRTPGRPVVPILRAIEAVADALDALGPTVLWCLVASEQLATHVRERVRATDQRTLRWRSGDTLVQLRTGDITAIAADAVVNASNTRLRLGAGVSAALRRACGPALQAEMSALAPIEPGSLAATSAHALMTTSRILHVATASGEADVIRHALANILAYGSDHALSTVAVPALGMGTGGLSREACCAAFRDTIANHAGPHPRTIIVVLWTAADYDAFAAGFAADARFALAE